MNDYHILTGHLPDTVKINGAEYAIRADFRTSIRFENTVRNPKLSEDEKLVRILKLYYPVIPADLKEAVEAALWFYHGGKRPLSGAQDNSRKHGRRGRELYSFIQDADYIYAAFLEQYGINLQRIPAKELHWWEFSALFQALGRNTRMGEMMYYRGLDTAGMSGRQKKEAEAQKRAYSLKQEQHSDREADLETRNRGWLSYIEDRAKEVNRMTT